MTSIPDDGGWLSGPMLHTSQLRRDIQDALNRHSAEHGSNTPDYILAGYLLSCLNSFDEAVKARTNWYAMTGSDAIVLGRSAPHLPRTSKEA